MIPVVKRSQILLRIEEDGGEPKVTKEYADYLAHYGILGQKWGVRRYQNEDGSYTEAGKQRLASEKGLTKKDGGSKKKPESSTWKSKDAPYLSDEELNRRNSRLQRENQYRSLTEPKRAKALKWIKTTASTILVASAIGAMKGGMSKNYGAAFGKYGPMIAQKATNLIAKYKKSRLSTLSSLGLKG